MRHLAVPLLAVTLQAGSLLAQPAPQGSEERPPVLQNPAPSPAAAPARPPAAAEAPDSVPTSPLQGGSRRSTRMVLEFFGGAVTVGAAGLATGGIAEVAGSSCWTWSCMTGSNVDPVIEVVLLSGFSLIAAAGVALVGDANGGTGRLAWTGLGSVLGTSLALGLTALGEPDYNDSSAVFVASLLVLPVLGALVGYELSSAGRAEPMVVASRRHTPQLVPVAAWARGGGTVGVGARF